MKRFKVLLVIPFIFLLSCSNFGSKYKDTNAQLSSIREEQHEVAKEYVTGTVDALGELDENQKTPETELAEELGKSAQEILGVPAPGDRINVKALLSDNDKIRQAARKVLEKKKSDDAKTANKIQELEAKLKETQAALIELGIQKEKENNSNIVKRIWAWAVGSFGLLGGIAFIVFCPALAIPLLGALLRFLVGMIPSLFSFVGVVGSSVVKNVVEGIGSIKESLNKAPANKTYTKDEVLAMMKTQLAMSMDKGDKEIVEAIKTKLDIK